MPYGFGSLPIYLSSVHCPVQTILKGSTSSIKHSERKIKLKCTEHNLVHRPVLGQFQWAITQIQEVSETFAVECTLVLKFWLRVFKVLMPGIVDTYLALHPIHHVLVFIQTEVCRQNICQCYIMQLKWHMAALEFFNKTLLVLARRQRVPSCLMLIYPQCVNDYLITSI